MEDRRGFDRVIAVLTLIVAIIAAYYAYRSYSLAGDTQVALKFYTRSEDKEINTDSLKIDQNNIKHRDGFMVFELPLKIVNVSGTDADKIRIFLGPESDGTYKLELLQSGCEWAGTEMFQKKWYVLYVDHIPPLAEINSKCVLISVKEGTKEVQLTWQALASHMLPIKSNLTLYF